MKIQSRTQRGLLLAFIGSLAGCALIGIYVILVGTFGWLEARVLGTTGVVTATSILALAAAAVWERRVWQTVGALAILVACGPLSVPILHRVSTLRRNESVVTTELKLTIACPRCGVSQTLPTGRTRCAGCGLKFLIEIEEEHCPKCGYALFQLRSERCPECGSPVLRRMSTVS